jgi:hypothetical protein
MNIIGYNSNSFFLKFYMLKYENSTLKICIRTVKHYTDIDPTVDFVFPNLGAEKKMVCITGSNN